MLELENITLVQSRQTLLNDVTWRIGPGERIGVVGVNGSGKTTLLNVLAGKHKPFAGKRIEGKTVKLAYLTQELAELPGAQRVLESIEQVAGRVTLGKRELSASQLVERLGFPAARQWTPVADLSGGERRRLQLARLLMEEPNVLLLDEPTNDLDIDTLQQLEDLLDAWPGSLIVVSHDRYLVERVCDTTVALLGDGKITQLSGGIDEYLRLRSLRRDGGDVARKPRRPAAKSTTLTAAQRHAATKELTRLERRLEVLQGKEKRLHEALAAAATDPEKLIELQSDHKVIIAEKMAVEEQWLTTSEALD